jgi:arsenate reductase-like glutaredoxin family protein
MSPCLAYRQMHEYTNTAATAMVVLAEFGLGTLEEEKRGQELTLHGLLQQGPFDESRGLVLEKALRMFADHGLTYSVFHDVARTAALQDRLRRWVPEFELRLLQDLRSPASAWESLDAVFDQDARVLLVEARHSIQGLRLHVLLARQAGHIHVMNSATGHDHIYVRGHFAAHLASPVSAGAVAFAGAQYLYTGVAVRVWKQAAAGVEKNS